MRIVTADANPSGDQSGSRSSWSWTPVNVAFWPQPVVAFKNASDSSASGFSRTSTSQRQPIAARETMLDGVDHSCTHAPSPKFPSLVRPLRSRR
jgi:hypothetical protein